MFAAKSIFLLLYNTAGQTKHDCGPNMTHRVCNLHLVSLDCLSRGSSCVEAQVIFETWCFLSREQ